MLRLDVIDTGVVAFQMPADIARADADDLDQALRLLAEGGCRAAIVDFDEIEHMTGEAMHIIAASVMRTRGTPMRLVFVVNGNPLAHTLMNASPLGRFPVFKTLPAAADACRKETATTRSDEGRHRKEQAADSAASDLRNLPQKA